MKILGLGDRYADKEENRVELELKLKLPDSLAREAEASRLLTPQGLEALLREAVQAYDA